MSTIERAITIAVQAHEGQIDKAGVPYILHPLRVMLGVSTNEERIAAVLHDVVEDSEWTLEQLEAEGFSNDIIEAIDALTKRTGEDYQAFVLRAGANPIARKVKLADLADNSDIARIANPTERDYERLEKYRKAIAILKEIDSP